MFILSLMTTARSMVTKASLVIHTDSESCLKTWEDAQSMTPTSLMRQVDKDIWSHLHVMKETWGERVLIQWVKAHVDRHKRWDDMTFEQKGNTLADKGAETIYQSYDQIDFPIIRTKLKWVMTLEGCPITGDIVQCLKDFCKMEKAKAFLQRKGGKHGVSLLNDVNWDPMRTLVKRWDVGRRVKYVKLVWGLVATSAVLSRRKEEPVDGTPLCKLCESGNDETAWHLYSECSHPELRELRRKTHLEVCKLLQDAGMESELVQKAAKAWEQNAEGVSAVMVGADSAEMIEDLGSDMDWSSSLCEELLGAHTTGPWQRQGLVMKAWTHALQALGLGLKKAQLITKKVVGVSLEGIAAAWHVRSRIFHELVSAAEEARALKTDEELRTLLDEDYYRNRPIVRERLLDCIRGAFTTAKKRKLLEKLKKRTRSAGVEVVKLGGKFSRLTDGTCQYEQTIFPGSHGNRWSARIEKVESFEEPTVALVGMVEEEKGDEHCVDESKVESDTDGDRRLTEEPHLISSKGVRPSESSLGEENNEPLVTRGRSRADRSEQREIMRWLKRSGPPCPPEKRPEKRVKVFSRFKSQARNHDIASSVDSREGMQLIQMDDFAQRMFAASNADVKKRKGVG